MDKLYTLQLWIVDKICKPGYREQKEGEESICVDFNTIVENGTTNKNVTYRKNSLRDLISKLSIESLRKINQGLIFI